MARLTAAPAPLAALGARLRERAETLAQEVRHYPTPIARCDEQLSGLLERRARLYRALGALEAFAQGAGAASERAALEAGIGALEPEDLGAELAADCGAVIAALRAEWRARAGGCGPVDAWANDGGSAA